MTLSIKHTRSNDAIDESITATTSCTVDRETSRGAPSSTSAAPTGTSATATNASSSNNTNKNNTSTVSHHRHEAKKNKAMDQHRPENHGPKQQQRQQTQSPRGRKGGTTTTTSRHGDGGSRNTGSDSDRKTASSTNHTQNHKNNNHDNSTGDYTTGGRPRPRPLQSYIPTHLKNYVLPYHGDFCLSPIFQSGLIAQLMVEGFLPIATEGYLLPKLHEHRCVIRLPEQLHISKSARKKAKRFRMTINQSFHSVVEGCRQQHGTSCWLYPPLVEAFYQIHQRGLEGMITNVETDPQHPGSSRTTTASCPVRFYTVEVWEIPGPKLDDERPERQEQNGKESDRLVAGELGYTVGSIYTSLTGFSRVDSAGSVQLAALGRILCVAGFTTWDLGMDMQYKRTLGSILLPRNEFVNLVRRVRVRDAHRTLPLLNSIFQDGNDIPTINFGGTSFVADTCRDVIDAPLPKSG